VNRAPGVYHHWCITRHRQAEKLPVLRAIFGDHGDVDNEIQEELQGWPFNGDDDYMDKKLRQKGCPFD